MSGLELNDRNNMLLLTIWLELLHLKRSIEVGLATWICCYNCPIIVAF